MGCCFLQKTCNISETGKDRTKVAIDDQYKVAYALSIGAKINDLGYLERPLRTLIQNTCGFGVQHEYLMKIDLYYQLRRCNARTLVSGKIRFMGYSWGFPGEGASNDSGVVENGNFFSPYFFRSFRGKANIIIYHQPG